MTNGTMTTDGTKGTDDNKVLVLAASEPKLLGGEKLWKKIDLDVLRENLNALMAKVQRLTADRGAEKLFIPAHSDSRGGDHWCQGRGGAARNRGRGKRLCITDTHTYQATVGPLP